MKKQFLGGTAIPERSSELPSRLETLGKGHDEPFLFFVSENNLERVKKARFFGKNYFFACLPLRSPACR